MLVRLWNNENPYKKNIYNMISFEVLEQAKGWKNVRKVVDSVDMSLSKLWDIVKDREAWHAAVHGVAKSWT